jgi:hypothetical protein
LERKGKPNFEIKSLRMDILTLDYKILNGFAGIWNAGFHDDYD